MILLDLDNLNILVLFILAFISFKGYQADANLFDSESEEELSEAEQESSKVQDDQEEKKSQQENSQQSLNAQPKLQMKRDEQKTNESIPEPERMISEENQDALYPHIQQQNGLNNDKHPQAIGQGLKYPELIENQGIKSENQEKCQEEKFDSCSYESGSQQNSDFDSIDESESVKNPEAPEKLKKIRKMAKQLKRDLKKQSELIQRLSEDVELEIQ